MYRKYAAVSPGRRWTARLAATGVLVAAVLSFSTMGALAAEASKAAGRGRSETPTTLVSTVTLLPAIPTGADRLIWESNRGIFEPRPAYGPALIHLGAGYVLDPGAVEDGAILPSDLRATIPTASERGHFIVQFEGPITPEDQAMIESFGGTVLGYVPHFALLVSLTGEGYQRAGASAGVRWTGLYHPAYKISPQPLMSEPGRREMLLLVFPDGSLDQVSAEVRAAGAIVFQEYDNGINKMLRVEIDTARLPSIARIEGVAWIEPYTQPILHNADCQWVVQTWQQNDRRIWDMGIRGEDQIISVCDSGIRTTHKMFFDPSVPLNGFGDYPNHRKITAYQKSGPFADVLFGDSGSSGYHGTHTSCTAAGNDAPAGGASTRDGMSMNARIYFLDAGGAGAGILVPADLNDLFILPYNGNAAGVARIVSNSWGRDNYGYYDAHSMTVDQFMWNHPDFLAFFSNGNTGQVNGVGSPATAKNVVSAGGTYNGTQANQLYASTSRGPTDDGRYKPTICAPAQLYSAYGANDTGYIQYHGTSMACPAMAGATVLIRQYLTEGWYPTGNPVGANAIANPSAALMKAMAVNSADPNVAGAAVPNNHIGWGRILVDDVTYFPGDDRLLALVDFTEGLMTGEYVEYQVYIASSAIPLKAALVWTDYPGSPGTGIQLVNDLNLVADDGTDTYLGNYYSGGQSLPGGTADNLNVEECVRRDVPATGVWTFRIEAFNCPFGPQPFALVITGGLAGDAGLIVLDKLKYGIEEMPIRVVDLNAGGSIQVTATSTTEPSTETIVLTGANGVYQGTLPLRPTYAVSGDGELSVSHGDQITITYEDANPVATLVARAEVDLIWTTITNVHATSVSETDAAIEWETTSLATSKVYYGTTPGLGEETDATASQQTQHHVVLSGLAPDQTYYYDVESSDHQGNDARDDNGGLHYTFTTGRASDVLLVIGDDTFTQRGLYGNAFARIGWSNTVWEGGQAATPFVGDAASGMASYKAVVWQTGYEQYPMFTDAARDSIAKLNDVGSRLAVYSHDVAWDFCDPTSPDYSVERCQWMVNELKATWQEDPTTWSLNFGYAGDPISGAYTGGVAYAPHRPGAAGDEINGVAGDGTFAYVWRDNDTSPDDIALRWTGNNPVGDPGSSIWAGTPNKITSNFFEWSRMNADDGDDPVRADILDKTITWLVGRDNPTVDLLAPDGGEVFTGNTVSISWTESVGGGYDITGRSLSYSDNGGESWTLITDSPGTSPYAWGISGIPNGDRYRVRMLIEDDGTPALHSVDASADVFTVDRPGGDTRGPKVLAGSMVIDPNPVLKDDPVSLVATLSDVETGNANVIAAEWSHGSDAAPPGYGSAMSGTFDSPTVDVSVVIDSRILTPGTDILWVRGQDAAGVWGNASALGIHVNGDPAGVDDEPLPARFALYASAPNPFNPVTTIRFDLPRESRVKLTVFDIAGRRVRTLLDGSVPAGRRSAVWDGRDEVGHPAGSGIYFYRLEAGPFRGTRRMTLLK